MAQRHTVQIDAWRHMEAYSLDDISIGYAPNGPWHVTAYRSDGSERTYRGVTPESLERIAAQGRKLIPIGHGAKPWPGEPLDWVEE